MIQQQGSALTGTIDPVGSACILAPTPFTGTLDGSTVTLNVSDGGTQGTYIGTLTGDSISGTLTVTCALGTGTGDWKATKK